jgi:hypothetical protein
VRSLLLRAHPQHLRGEASTGHGLYITLSSCAPSGARRKADALCPARYCPHTNAPHTSTSSEDSKGVEPEPTLTLCMFAVRNGSTRLEFPRRSSAKPMTLDGYASCSMRSCVSAGKSTLQLRLIHLLVIACPCSCLNAHNSNSQCGVCPHIKSQSTNGTVDIGAKMYIGHHMDTIQSCCDHLTM